MFTLNIDIDGKLLRAIHKQIGEYTIGAYLKWKNNCKFNTEKLSTLDTANATLQTLLQTGVNPNVSESKSKNTWMPGKQSLFQMTNQVNANHSSI